MANHRGRAYRTRRWARRLRRLGDFEHLESRRLLVIVNIAAEDPNAAESGPDNGLFRVVMSEPHTAPTEIKYAIGGSATNGQDYAPLSGTVTIQPNFRFAEIPVQVIDDTLAEGNETVVITLIGTSQPNDVVDKTPATVNIADNDANQPPKVVTNTGSTVVEGSVDVITGNELRSSDPDTPPSGLLYTVTSAPANGTVQLNGAPTTSFRQTDIDAGNVSYRHNGGESTSDAFTFSISDGTVALGGNTFHLTVTPVNDVPTVVNPIADRTVPEESPPTTINLSDVFTDADPGDKLTYSAVSSNSAVVATAISGTTLSLSYRPNQAGNVVITVTATDSKGAQATDLFNVNVTNVNDPVDAQDDVFTTAENTALSANVLANDVDPDNIDADPANDTLTVALLSPPANGTLSFNTNGDFTYTPAADFSGADSFTYQARDNKGATDQAKVTINVTNINRAPTAVDDAFSTRRDTPVVGNVLANDSDPDNDPLLATLQKAPPNGTVTLQASGQFTYTPNNGFFGADSFQYLISDGQGGTDLGEVKIEVTTSADLDASDDTFTRTEDTPVGGNLLANDVDPDGDPFTLISTTPPSNGSLTADAQGIFTYTPIQNFFGTDSFTYTIRDSKGFTDTAKVTLTFTPINDVDARNDTYSTTPGTSLNVQAPGLLANDVDPDTNPEHQFPTGVVPFSGGTSKGGSVTVNGNGSFSYTPAPGFFGADTFTYTITDSVGAFDTATATINVDTPNNPPDARNDSVTGEDDTKVQINVLANDTDPDGDPLTVISVSAAANGQASIGAGGVITYEPNSEFSGIDSFTYTISDGRGGTDTAVVTVFIHGPHGPIARDDTFKVNEDTIRNALGVLVNDFDPAGSAFKVVAVTQGSKGIVEVGPNGANVLYTPDPNFSGVDTFTYTITDRFGAVDIATVTVTVQEFGEPPNAVDDQATVAEDSPPNVIAVLLNDSDPDGTFKITAVTQGSNGAVAIRPGSLNLTYQPNPNFFGTDSFSYTISDDEGNSDTAIVTVTVSGTPDPPDAQNDAAGFKAGSQNNPILVLANDVDADNDPLTITKVTSPASGTAIIAADGKRILYTPNAGFVGSDVFQYTITDPSGQTDSASVSVTIAGVLPSPVDDVFQTSEDTAITMPEAQLLANDFNPDSLPIMITSVGGAFGGTATLNADRSVTFVPTPNSAGVAGFNYTISGAAPNDTGLVTINVLRENKRPLAGNDQATVFADSAGKFIDVLANDTDPDGDNVFVISVTPAANGTVTIIPGIDDPDEGEGGGVRYTPNPGFVGVDTFTYSISDPFGARDTAEVTVIVSPPPQPPSPVDDQFTSIEDQVVTLTEEQITQNDFDPNAAPIDITKVSNPVGGTVVLNADDSVTFTPNLNFAGVASFEYEIAGAVAGDRGLVTIIITAVNEVDARDDVFNTPIGLPVFFGSRGVLANDFDPEGDAIVRAVLSEGPANGVVELNGDGSFTYTANPGFVGTDSFMYTAYDARDASDTAKVTINVVDASPVARGDEFSVQEGSKQNFINVLGDDADPEGDKLIIVAVTQPRNGKVTIVNGGLLYEPDPGFVGIDEFSYTVSDDEGDVIADILDIALVTVFVHSTSVTYFPMDDDFARPEDTVVTLTEADLVSNDYNPSKLPLDIASVTNPVGGNVALNLDGSVTFTPTPNFAGLASFRYRCASPLNAFDAQVEIDFTPLFDAPTAADDAATVNEDSGANSIDVLANDVDVDGDLLLVSAVTQGANGSVTIGPGGLNVLYTPAANFSGVDTFTYTTSDGNGGTDTATVAVDVLNVDSGFLGTAGDDVFLVRRDAGGTNLEVFANDTGLGSPLFSTVFASASALLFDTLAGNDRLIIDLANGNPLPSGGIDFLAGGNTGVGDQLVIQNAAAAAGVYLPSATQAGEGALTLDGRSIDFTGVEPIQVSDFMSFTAITPNADDILTAVQPTPSTTELAGTSGGISIAPLHFTNIGTLILDAAANDAAGGNDSLSVTAGNPLPNGTNFLEYHSGTGANTLNLQSGAARIDATVDASGTLDTVLAASAELATHRFRQTSLDLGLNSEATVLPAGTLDAVSRLESLTLAAGAKLDINDNALVLDYTGASPETAVRAAIVAGRGGTGIGNGLWSGVGIASSAAAAANLLDPESRSIGYAENATLPLGAYATFRGQPVDDTSILIAFTRTGDANLDSLVNDDDVTVLGAFFPSATGSWATADVDYTGALDDNDATLLGAFYDPSAAAFPVAAPQQLHFDIASREALFAALDDQSPPQNGGRLSAAEIQALVDQWFGEAEETIERKPCRVLG